MTDFRCELLRRSAVQEMANASILMPEQASRTSQQIFIAETDAG
jgi:hypothetical protein